MVDTMGSMSNKNDFQFIANKSLTFKGCHPEYADMDNPQGRMYGEEVIIESINSYGEVYVYLGEVKDQDHANRLVDIFGHRSNRHEFDIDNDEWRFNRNSYGSQAYQDNWMEEEAYSDRLDQEVW
jgi:hypothetical protein